MIADELTVWSGPDLWEALVSATGKVEDAQTIVLSNAGFDPANSWQFKVRETAADEAWGYRFSADGPIASWISAEWVERMRRLLPTVAFARVVENVWSALVGDFVTAEQWARCVDPYWMVQTEGERGRSYVGALDLGLVKDRTAFAIAHRDDDGNIRLDDLQVWEGTRAQPVEIEQVERALIDASERFAPLRILADPWQFESSRQRLDRAGVSIEPFNFTAQSVQRLSATLYALITAARLRVFPDPELEREVLALRVVQRDAGWRIDHRAGGFADRAVAVGMAALALGERRRRSIPDEVHDMFAAMNRGLARPSAFQSGRFGTTEERLR